MVKAMLNGTVNRRKAVYSQEVELAFTARLDRMLRRRLDAKGMYGPVSVRFPDGSREMVC